MRSVTGNVLDPMQNKSKDSSLTNVFRTTIEPRKKSDVVRSSFVPIVVTTLHRKEIGSEWSLNLLRSGVF